ncbi:MAG: J domain-containing protein [Terriglobia bacterium]
MEAEAESSPTPTSSIRHAQVIQIEPHGEKTACCLSEGGRILVSNLLAAQVRPGDEIDFPLAFASDAGTEIFVHKNPPSPRQRDVYQVSIGYAAQPKSDKREQFYVHAEVPHGCLGISALYFPCEVLRDYFYAADRRLPWEKQKNLFDILRIPPSASPAELRLAFRLCGLELRAAGAPTRDFNILERAFNILAQPELRACYVTLSSIFSSVPALLSFCGFGSIVVSGGRSSDGQTFFVRRILSFIPEHRQRRFRAPLRKFDFYNDHALYRDARRKLEVLVDPALVPLVWDATWNQWKHLLGAKVEIKATFVETGNYRHRGGAWHLVKWETALPSRIEVRLPADIAEQVETARETYHRFGQFSDALDRIRARIQREPVERDELRRICWDHRIPSDFDIAQINWLPDYDSFFYRQLYRRARRLYLFRDEYIFDLEKAVVVETPRLGHATYLFAKPSSMEQFLNIYATTTKEDIRLNRGNVAEKLGFLGRVVHGANPRLWLKTLKSRLGEAVDSTEESNGREEPGGAKT